MSTIVMFAVSFFVTLAVVRITFYLTGSFALAVLVGFGLGIWSGAVSSRYAGKHLEGQRK